MTFSVAVYHLRRKSGKIWLVHCTKKARSGCLLVSSQGCFQIRQSSMVIFSESKMTYFGEVTCFGRIRVPSIDFELSWKI